ncbi:hypothetical protein, conserved [Eimeria necatrix]|uniref:Uncharacterized protein n=1 Tax=Eimeria necatrix TaxID=51315 RepID=U6MML3_9EIME|nr:hypothetical protein, conserved [Eimeria necatrix]CDJ62895.1 hypothetical protein, conserved [Eimeria necatrix]
MGLPTRPSASLPRLFPLRQEPQWQQQQLLLLLLQVVHLDQQQQQLLLLQAPAAKNEEAFDSFAVCAENLKKPLDNMAEAVDGKAAVATKAELQAAAKTLGMGTSAFRGLPKDDEAAYCKELQSRVLKFIENASGEHYESLPSAETLAEVKKAAEAKKELSSLDPSNIIEAIKRDIQRDLEREAAQASSEPQPKKPKTDEAAAAAAASSSSSSSSSSSGNASSSSSKDAEGAPDTEEEEEDSDSDSCSGSGSSSSSSSSSSGSGSEEGEGSSEESEAGSSEEAEEEKGEA